jgi:dTDP-4-dehydrorhamnose reductase
MLARAAASVGATFVHYSTDFVFDGVADRPYSEDDAPNPQSVYASSKLVGEWFAADAPSHYVLRVESLFGGTQRRSSVDRIVDAIRDGRPARVFVDRTVSPSFVEDVAEATWTLLHTRPAPGVYHCVNSGATTWHVLAQAVAKILRLEATLVPVPVAEVKLRAQRPKYCALANEKLRRAAFDMPTWRDALERYLRPDDPRH